METTETTIEELEFLSRTLTYEIAKMCTAIGRIQKGIDSRLELRAAVDREVEAKSVKVQEPDS